MSSSKVKMGKGSSDDPRNKVLSFSYKTYGNKETIKTLNIKDINPNLML